jgi:heptaprenylglyceryl phosphate synthase
MVKIPVGSILTFTRNPEVTCKVINDTQIEYAGEVRSLSEAAKLALGIDYNVAGTLYWEYEDETLDERRRRFEEGEDEEKYA